MSDKSSGRKFWGVLGLASIALITVATGMGMAESCKAGFAATEIRKPAAAGCGEFWLNRYQGLVVGIGSIVVAIVGILAVLRQLSRMDQSNQVADRAMRIAADQLAAGHRRDISHAINALMQVRAHLYSLTSTLQLAPMVGEVRTEERYEKWLDGFIPHLNHLRQAMFNIHPSAAVESAYDQFERCFRGGVTYFGAEHHRELQGVIADNYDAAPARSIAEAREYFLETVRALSDVQAGLHTMRAELMK